MTIRWLLLVLLCLLPYLATATGSALPQAADAAAHGLDEPAFQSVGAGSIPRDVVPSMTQDRAGFLWVSTGDGLVRYDGYRFRPQERDSPQLKDRNLGWIPAQIAGRDGRVWIGTETDGLVVYEPETDSMTSHRWPGGTNYRHSTNGTLPTITAMAEDLDGGLWVGTLGGGLLRFDPTTAIFTTQSSQDSSLGLPDDRISALLVDLSGNLWVGTWQGLSLRRAGGDRFTAVSLGSQIGGATARLAKMAKVVSAAAAAGTAMNATTIRALYQAQDGSVWFGTDEGALYRVFPGADVAIAVAQPAEHEALGAVTSLIQASDGKLWVGRTTGIDLHDGQTGQLLKQVRHDPRRHQGLAGNHVTSLLLDRAGSIWVAGFGLGLQRHEPGSAIRLRGVDLKPGSPFDSADTRALLQLRSGEVWAAVHQRGVVELDERLNTRRQIAPPKGNNSTPPNDAQTTAMMQAADDSIWLAGTEQLQQLTTGGKLLSAHTHGGSGANHLAEGPDRSVWLSTSDGLYRLRPGASRLNRVLVSDGLPLAGAVRMTALAPDGALWIAAVNGLYRIAAGADIAQTIEAQAGAELANASVLALLFDSQGSLWLDTSVSGLHRMTAWDGRKASFDQVSARHHIYNRPFGSNLLEDAAGRIWSHMHVYDPQSDKLHVLTAADGVNFGTGWFLSYAKLADGRLLFGGAKGILVVQPDRFQTAAYAPPLVVSEIRVDGVRAPASRLAAGIELQPGQRSLSVEFAALDFLQPSDHRYAYRLSGFDPDWISTGVRCARGFVQQSQAG